MKMFKRDLKNRKLEEFFPIVEYDDRPRPPVIYKSGQKKLPK